jgi:hypothetical protein
MTTFTRLLALAVLTLSILSPGLAQAQENERTAGRQAGEPLPAKAAKAETAEVEAVKPKTDVKPKKSKKPKAAEIIESTPEAAPTMLRAPKARKALPPPDAAAEDQKPPSRPGRRMVPVKKDVPVEEDSKPAAAPAATPATNEKILKVEYEDLESVGLYSTPQDGSLGRDLWTNSHRSVLVEYLPQLKTVRKSPVLQFLTDGLLLSQAQAGLIENDIPPEPGKDILTLRLMKLMDLGMSDEALKIYSDLGRVPYHSNLAQAGIMAILFNGEKSLACLEYKTMEDRKFQGPFWTDIAAYCNYVLEDKKPADAEFERISSEPIRRIVSGAKFSVAYDARKFAEIPLFDRAILTAENRIDFGGLGLEGIRRIAPAHLTMALKKPGLSRQDAFLIQMKMVQYGLKSPAEWEKLYAGYRFGGAADEQKIITLESMPGWQQPLALYQNVKTLTKGPEQRAMALQALSYTWTYGLAAATPLADILASVPADNLSTEQLVLIARILNAADKDVPGSWFDVLSKRKGRSDKEMALTVLSYVAKAYQQTNPADKDVIVKAVQSIKNSTLKDNFMIIIENVDNTVPDQHTVNKVYDNGSDLTSDGNYVMPSKRVWDRLIASSQNQSIGETVLLSTVLLNDKPLMDLYPGVLGDVLKGLRAVGLTRFSKGIAQEALLETL